MPVITPALTERIIPYTGMFYRHERFLTWLPGSEPVQVEVDHATQNFIVATTGERYRRPSRGSRRTWAKINPDVTRGVEYLVVTDGEGNDHAVAGDIVTFGPSAHLGRDYYMDQWIATLPVAGRRGGSVFVRDIVALSPAAVVVPASHINRLGAMPDGTVRVITHRDQALVGTVQDTYRAYQQDRSATGVMLTSTHPGSWDHLIHTDPGAGPYTITDATVVPSNHVRGLGGMLSRNRMQVRVITHTNTALIGQIMGSSDAYYTDASATGVAVSIEPGSPRYDHYSAMVAPDPGEGPYVIGDPVNPPEPTVADGFTIGDRVVWTGNYGNVYWRGHIHGVVREVRRDHYTGLSINVRADDDQPLDATVDYTTQWVDSSNLVHERDYVAPEPHEVCGRFPCACVNCHECGEVMVRGAEGVRVSRDYYQPRYFHDACSQVCEGCEAVRGLDSMAETDAGETFCDSCIHTCDECDEYNLAPETRYCEDCEGERSEGIRGYGRTRPTMWLGGPLPTDEAGHQQGFYIGFELEISANHTRMRSLRDWSEQHLGSRTALDPKRDGSVEGFEIATMPMTPEFFEGVDWDSFMAMLEEYETFDDSESREPTGHGLHVHIGRIAFERDDVAQAMFSYLIGQDNGSHLERVGRREATHYCEKVAKPLSTALVDLRRKTGTGGYQADRIARKGGSQPGRNAINLTGGDTIEIRAFRSTRDADHLRAAVRMVYLAARYVAALRGSVMAGPFGRTAGGFVSPKALHWDQFVAWVETVMPEAAEDLRAPAKEEVDPTTVRARKRPAFDVGTAHDPRVMERRREQEAQRRQEERERALASATAGVQQMAGAMQDWTIQASTYITTNTTSGSFANWA